MNPLENLPPFYVGQKVVYVTGLNMPKDSVHVVLEIKHSFCGCIIIKIKQPSGQLDSNTTHVRCSMCQSVYPVKHELTGYWHAESFRPLQESVFPTLTLSRVIEKELQLTSMN